MTKLHELANLGQAIWIDFIRRSFLDSGELSRLIDMGLRGMTSNPSIFEKAIAHSQDYAANLAELAAAGKSTEEIYTDLAVADIQQAADLFRPLYDQTDGADGYVSIEVSPLLAHNTAATVAEARQLWATVNRPNLMVKIPATLAGIPAITSAIADGINVNVTLIFSLERYGQVMAAYLAGLETRRQAGIPLDRIHSVASFFVSRVDGKVDALLERVRQTPEAELAESLLGQAAVANAKIAYQQFKAVFLGEPFAVLRAAGANVQRPLWASTSTKNPAYSDILYVQELIGLHTVNTLPQDTLEAFLDHGEPRLTIESGLDAAKATLQNLAGLGISMQVVTSELESEGVAAFAKSYDSLLTSIETQRAAHAPAPSDFTLVTHLGPFESAVRARSESLQVQDAVTRLWQEDYTLWRPEPTEISNRLGWLHSEATVRPELTRIHDFVRQTQTDGLTQVVLAGMGGSSLAPELFARTFGTPPARLQVIDSTTPTAVAAITADLDPARALFIISTKSGTTEETLSFFKYFYCWLAARLPAPEVGSHFVAITDPGSKLVALAEQYHFRAVFLNDPNIGGRYSALSLFGIVPAALVGASPAALLDSAAAMAARIQQADAANPALRLGALLGELALQGRDKLTLLLSPEIAGFGDWVEQLIAESTGKEGRGILPVVGEPFGSPTVYEQDRLFVRIWLADDEPQYRAFATLQEASFPTVDIILRDRDALGGQFLLWEAATALAAVPLQIQPFDQPNVEAAKVKARAMVAAYKQEGSLPSETPQVTRDGIAVYGRAGASSPRGALADFLSQAEAGDYVALQAFLPPSADLTAALQSLRMRIRDRCHLATTVGYGPRFLHSTGQLHKGDAGRGLFVQFTGDFAADLPIPDDAAADASSLSFGVLAQAQALGDRQALLDAGRRVIRFHFHGDPAAAVRQLAEAIS